MRPGLAAPRSLLPPRRHPGLAWRGGSIPGLPQAGLQPHCLLYHCSSPMEDVRFLLLPWMARTHSLTWTSSHLRRHPLRCTCRLLRRSRLPQWGRHSFQTWSSCTCPRPHHSPWRRGLHCSLGLVTSGPRRRSYRLPQKSLLAARTGSHPQTCVPSATRPCPPESWPWRP